MKKFKFIVSALALISTLAFTSCQQPTTPSKEEVLKADKTSVTATKEKLSIETTVAATTTKVTLPAKLDGKDYEGVAITWATSDDKIIKADGTVTHTNFAGDQTVKLTATLKKGEATDSKEFTITVKNTTVQEFEMAWIENLKSSTIFMQSETSIQEVGKVLETSKPGELNFSNPNSQLPFESLPYTLEDVKEYPSTNSKLVIFNVKFQPENTLFPNGKYYFDVTQDFTSYMTSPMFDFNSGFIFSKNEITEIPQLADSKIEEIMKASINNNYLYTAEGGLLKNNEGLIKMTEDTITVNNKTAKYTFKPNTIRNEEGQVFYRPRIIITESSIKALKNGTYSYFWFFSTKDSAKYPTIRLIHDNSRDRVFIGDNNLEGVSIGNK